MKTSRTRSISLIATGAVFGVVCAGAVGAYAASNDSGTSTPSSSSAPARDGDGDGPGHDGRGGHAGEKALTGSQLTKATTAAKAAVPGGTVERAETDSGDATYEVHMTKSDKTPVTVKLDKSFKVTAVEAGMGK